MSCLIVWTNKPCKLCFSGILKRYIQKLSPGQLHLFCKHETKQKMTTYVSLGWPDAKMSPNQPIGINQLRNMFKMCAEIVGLEFMDKFSGHALRSYFLTHLYNSPDVSCVEDIGAARHKSVASRITYIQRNQRSEAGRFCDLQQDPIVSTNSTNSTPTTLPNNPYSHSLVNHPLFLKK